jgi:hypothetical protein
MLTIQRRHFLLVPLAVIPFWFASNYSTLILSILVFVSLARNLHFDLCASFVISWKKNNSCADSSNGMLIVALVFPTPLPNAIALSG